MKCDNYNIVNIKKETSNLFQSRQAIQKRASKSSFQTVDKVVFGP